MTSAFLSTGAGVEGETQQKQIQSTLAEFICKGTFHYTTLLPLVGTNSFLKSAADLAA